MLSEFVELIEQDMRGGGYEPMPPASPAEIAELERRAAKALGHDLPEEYLEFLSLMDGFYISSMQLFASRKRPLKLENGDEDSNVWIDDVVDMNLELRAERMEHEHLISLAYDQMLRGWDSVARQWYSREHVRGRHRIYRNFEELLADGLWDVGVDVRHLVPSDFEFSSSDDNGLTLHGTKV